MGRAWSWGIVLAVLLLSGTPAEADRLLHAGVLKCSACRAIAKEMVEKKKKHLEQEKQPIQVSHRLGTGKWDPHGDGGVKKMDYANSEILAIETIEGLCDSFPSYFIREVDGERVFTTDSDAGASSAAYVSSEKQIFSDVKKTLQFYCEQLVGDNDEEAHALVMAEKLDLPRFEEGLCEKIDNVCSPAVLAKAKVKEAAKKAKYEDKKRQDWAEQRQGGTAGKHQIADIHLSLAGVRLNLTGLNFTVKLDGKSPTAPPKNEGPESVLDSNATTKWLNSHKLGVILEVPTPVTVDAFSFTTANDHPERDPVRWEFSAGVLIAEEAPAEPAAEAEAGGEPPKEPAAANYTWVTLHSRTSPPYPTPFERGHDLPQFNFSQPHTAAVFRFRPIFGRPNGAKKAKKPSSEPAAGKADEEL
ncbi:hypothetical protein DIPPA_01559 [Diplonema papillatum]|nr:hypothetical protein DIPPA_01559 [Diplonema papillatum]